MQEIIDCVSVIEDRREEYGMTIRALARKSGVDENVLYCILNRKRRMMASELLSISEVLHLTFEDFKPEKAV